MQFLKSVLSKVKDSVSGLIVDGNSPEVTTPDTIVDNTAAPAVDIAVVVDNTAAPAEDIVAPVDNLEAQTATDVTPVDKVETSAAQLAAVKGYVFDWIDAHREKFKRVHERVPDQKYDHQIDITPEVGDALGMTFVFGGEVDFLIKVNGEYHLPEAIEVGIIERILDAYIAGKYYVLEKRLYNQRIASELVINVSDAEQYRSLSGTIDAKDPDMVVERRVIFSALA